MSVASKSSRKTDTTARGNDDGLKMCVFTPSRCQRRNSLASEADRHHHELPIEPRVLEPEEQREAEDDGKWAEAQSERAAVRPRQQAVEAVGKKQLRNDQRRRVVHLAPVEAPVEDQRALQARLQVVLRAQRHFERSPSARAAGRRTATRSRRAAPTRRRRSRHARRGADSSSGSWLSTSKPTTNAAFTENAPRADSRVLKVGTTGAGPAVAVTALGMRHRIHATREFKPAARAAC